MTRTGDKISGGVSVGLRPVRRNFAVGLRATTAPPPWIFNITRNRMAKRKSKREAQNEQNDEAMEAEPTNGAKRKNDDSDSDDVRFML
jgi:DNA-directed RNA polymerase specialized sigma24 family protein